MKALRTTLALLAGLSIAACSRYEWRKPGAQLGDVSVDQKICQFEAEKATATMRTGDNRVWRQLELEHACMEARGYVSTRK